DNTTQVNGAFGVPDWWANGSGANIYPNERGVRLIDINGDGKADRIRGYQNTIPGSEQLVQSVSINNSTSGSYSWSGTWSGTTTSTTIPIFALNNNSFDLSGGVFGDVNGDGLPDYETYLPGNVAATSYLGNGSAWEATTTVFIPAQSFPVTAPSRTASQ